MSEIDRLKFRVWDPKIKSFYWDFLISSNGYALYTPLAQGEDENRLVIEQCIGLKDVNGRLIFEGDIVCIIEYGDYEYNKAKERKQIVEIVKDLKVPEYNEPPFINKNHSQVILWDNKRATFMMKDRINSTGRPESLRNKRYVVIGNIHENPGLFTDCEVV
ncbi:MAG: YopX family protein [Alphaproteobacteria bacterium]|nr:YopX family protein [Alphaproteobacteria bacterium]